MEHAELIRRLEAERNDISYRVKHPKPLVKVETKVRRIVPEQMKKMFFHAGRYAAGDRDTQAVKAWQKYVAQEGLE